MSIEIRKVVQYQDTSLIEGGKKAEKPLQLFAAAAVVTNPWAGRGFVDDLSPEIRAAGPVLGQLLTDSIIQMTGSGQVIEAYGKAAVVGMSGEVEHASALIHTLHFGNIYRNAVEAQSYLSFTNTRGPGNSAIMVPLMHKDDAGMRSHYLTIAFAIADAPADNEIVVVLGASIGGRPHHRIGDRYKDLEELGHDHENPTGSSKT